MQSYMRNYKKTFYIYSNCKRKKEIKMKASNVMYVGKFAFKFQIQIEAA